MWLCKQCAISIWGHFRPAGENDPNGSLTLTTYAVSDPAFGRAVLYLLLNFGFCALRAQKPKYRYNGKYHAAAGLKAFECGTT
jgi:hypothetical protein